MTKNLKMTQMIKTVKFYKRRTYALFTILMLVIGYYVKTDIVNLVQHRKQQDTISIRDLTIKELNYKILESYEQLNYKEKEIEILKINVELLKDAVREKRSFNNSNIIDTKSIHTDSTGNVIKIGE